jgi:hypothetical protein
LTLHGGRNSYRSPEIEIGFAPEGKFDGSKSCALTGATGKIGSAVAAQLLEKGMPARAMVDCED